MKEKKYFSLEICGACDHLGAFPQSIADSISHRSTSYHLQCIISVMAIRD